MANIPNDCIVEWPPLGRVAFLAAMPDGSKRYIPMVNGSFDFPKNADDTYLITFDGDMPVAHPSNKLYYDHRSMETYQSDYVPELP